MTSYLMIFDGLPGVRQSYRDILDRAGYRTIVALAMDDAIRHTAALSPEAIIVEASGGVDAAMRHIESLRIHPRTAHLPILLLLPVGAQAPERLSESPSFSSLREPCSPRQLLDEIQYLTTPRRSGSSAWAEGQGTRRSANHP